jgi:chromosome partitioning protein
MLMIACLSQKGGVGKSTFARLIATAYAHSGWEVKIADFNTKQKTSTDWAAMRQELVDVSNLPAVAAETFSSVKAAQKQSGNYDLMVFDGRPDSDSSSLEIARVADLIVIPVGVALDDLKPQVLFAHELASKGIDKRRMIFFVNRTVDSELACQDARAYIEGAGYQCAKTWIPMRTGYQIAQNSGRSIIETLYMSLNMRASELAAEIVAIANKRKEVA